MFEDGIQLVDMVYLEKDLQAKTKNPKNIVNLS